jgi:hypothetical protein
MTTQEQLQDERETRTDLQWRLRILENAVQQTLAQLDHPDYPPISDGAMIRGRLHNALDKATR